MLGVCCCVLTYTNSAADMLSYNEVNFDALEKALGGSALSSVHPSVREYLEVEYHYAADLERQAREVEQMRKQENILLPTDIDYESIPALSGEEREKLARNKPLTLGDVVRIQGVSPNAMLILFHLCQKMQRDRDGQRRRYQFDSDSD